MKKNEEQKSREKKRGMKKKMQKSLGSEANEIRIPVWGRGRKFFALIFLETRPGRN